MDIQGRLGFRVNEVHKRTQTFAPKCDQPAGKALALAILSLFKHRSTPTKKKVALDKMSDRYAEETRCKPGGDVHVFYTDRRNNVGLLLLQFFENAKKSPWIEVFEKVPRNFLNRGVRLPVIPIHIGRSDRFDPNPSVDPLFISVAHCNNDNLIVRGECASNHAGCNRTASFAMRRECSA